MEFKSAGQLASDVKYCKIYGATKEQPMATMIPKTINTSNYTELQVFKRLRDESPTTGWFSTHYMSFRRIEALPKKIARTLENWTSSS